MTISPVVASPTLDQQEFSMDLNRFDGQDWVNVSIVNTEFAVVSSDIWYAGLAGSLLDSPEWALSSLVDAADFFNLQSMDEGNFELFIKMDGQENRILFDTILADPTPAVGELFAAAGIVADNILGRTVDQPVWPIDFQVFIMESYPEQYGISAKVIRGMDMLDYVAEGNITLLIGPDDETGLDWVSEPIYKQVQQYSLAGGGDSQEISFTTFSLGEEYRPNELQYVIFLDNAVIQFSNGLPSLSSVESTIVDSIGEGVVDGKGGASTGDLPAGHFLIFLSAILAIPVLRRRL
jgi:hypothetical protein